MTGVEILALLQLINALAPAGVNLVKTLAENLQGKTDAEILAAADAIEQHVIQVAKQELGQ